MRRNGVRPADVGNDGQNRQLRAGIRKGKKPRADYPNAAGAVGAAFPSRRQAGTARRGNGITTFQIMVQERIYGYFKRNPQLHVLFIFDRMNIIRTELEDAKGWDDGYVYKVFDGAWFNTKYDIENTWKDKRVVLLFSGETYPGTEERQLHFPLLDMLKANMEYKEEDYEDFMQQHGLPDRCRAFVRRNIGEMTSSKVSAMLSGYLTADTFNEDVACRAFIGGYLGEGRLPDWESIVVKMIILDGGADVKRRQGFFSRMEKNRDVKRMVDERLTRWFGRSYDPNGERKMKPVAESLKYNGITQLLEASAADLYKTYKTTDAAALEQMNKILEAGYRRGRDFGEALAMLAADIREEEIVRVYGTDAPYCHLTEALCRPIVEEALKTGLTADPAKVNARMRELDSGLPGHADGARAVVRFVKQTAQYYDKARSIGTLRLNTPGEYVQKYETEYYLVDSCYRHALEKYHDLMSYEMPTEDTIGEAKRRLDLDYADLVNRMNLEWLTCVTEKGNAFADVPLPRQQDFYKKEADATVKQAVIVSDALRYEVAEELMQQLAKQKLVAKLTPYLAMLPTETKYCKPALLPHRSLELQGTEMAVDGAVLTTTEQRTAHLRKYREKAICVKYEDVMNRGGSMREFFKNWRLVYIFHDTIDEASHSQNPFEVIEACRRAVEHLAKLVRLLLNSWDVTSVLLTADHGFIYNDKPFEDKDKHSVPADGTVEKKTRYCLTTDGGEEEGMAKFPLGEVSGMAAPGVFVTVPLGTNRMAAPGGYNFAHGGASLQEMIVPVIRSNSLPRTEKTGKVGVELMNRNLTMVSSRLKFHVIQSDAVNTTVKERKIVCLIFNGDEAVTAEKGLTLDSPDPNLNNRVREVTMNLNKSAPSGILELRIYDADDRLNPIVREAVKNNTMIEQDF